MNRGKDEIGGNVLVRNIRDLYLDIVIIECYVYVFWLFREDISDFNSVLREFVVSVCI